MTQEQIQKSLQDMPLFRTLSPGSLKLLASKLEIKSFPLSEIVIRKGETGDCLYIIHSGQVKVLTEIEGEEIILSFLEAGDHFGEMALLTGDPRSATVMTTQDTECFVLFKIDFNELLHREPSLFFRFSRILSERLKDSNQKILNAVKKKLKGSPGLTGKLGMDQKISGLLKFCESNTLTGTLSITHRAQSAILEFDKGHLENIQMAGKDEVSAMDELITWIEGVYLIQPKIFGIAQELTEHAGPRPKSKTSTHASIHILLELLNTISNYYRGIIGNVAVSNIFRRSQLVLIGEWPFLANFVVFKEGTIGLITEPIEPVTDDDVKSIAFWAAFIFENCIDLAIGLYAVTIEHITRSVEDTVRPIRFYDYFYEFQKNIPKSDILVTESGRL